MAFEDNLPQDADTLVQQSKTDVQLELNKIENPNRSNTFLDASWLGAIPAANANRVFDYYLQLEEAINLNMPDTARDEFATRWGTIYVGPRTPVVGSVGNTVATGNDLSVIDIGTGYQSSDGIEYRATSTTTITAQSLSVLSITNVGTLATLTTIDDHGLASNVQATISGANETEYNGTFSIQVTGPRSFTYTLPSTPAGSATGTIFVDFTSGSVPIEAVPPNDPLAPFGSVTNQVLDAPLTLQSTIIGVDSISNVDFNELGGGADEETDPVYKARYLDKLQNPIAHYSPSDIDQKMRTVPGVTRTFIQKSGEQIGTVSISSINRFDVIAKVVTSTPHGLFTSAEITISGANQAEYNIVNAPILVIDTVTFAYEVSGTPTTPATGTITASAIVPLGRVQIYFTRDLDVDPIPTVGELAEVKDAILEITPANTPDSFVLVDAPIPDSINFTFTELNPDVPTMREAVTANLDQFFKESVQVGSGIDEDGYRSAVFNTVDTETGFVVKSFSLSEPTGDIVGQVGHLPILGDVNF